MFSENFKLNSHKILESLFLMLYNVHIVDKDKTTMWSFREKLVGGKFYRSIGVITLLCNNFNRTNKCSW